MNFPPAVTLVEVGPRDGLQNESSLVDTSAKVHLIHQLAGAGLSQIEIGSFVSPAWVPQMADTAEVFRNLPAQLNVTYLALVPNVKGLCAAMDVGVTDIAVFVAASETFSKRNTNATMKESLARARSVIAEARLHNLRVRGYVSCAWGCPYEGPVPPAAVLTMAKPLFELGCYEISLGDTIGVATPRAVQSLVSYLSPSVPVSSLSVHFHDTRGQALANILASMDMGISVIDSSVAGLGGCPYAPGAAGNVATEDVVYMLHGMGIETGVNLPRLIEAGRTICRRLGRSPSSKVSATC